MNIYNLLASKPHNPHYLNRYIKFIRYCDTLDTKEDDLENHHICPKSKDMFIEYRNFELNPWNRISLTKRQHFIAHHLLWKAFPESKSQMYAVWLLSGRIDNKMYSGTYEKLKCEYVKHRYNKIIPKGMTLDEHNIDITEKLKEEKIRLTQHKISKKLKLEEEKFMLKYNPDNDLCSCLCCRGEVKSRFLHYHYSISYGTCSINRQNKSEWISPRKQKLK